MLKSKTTKSALISSVIALVLCFTMLIGSTFAWFTDSITSANNIIKSGNLDIELYHTDDTDAHEKVGSNTVLFDDVALWEPGAVVYETFEVVNEGSLALKYQLSINVTNATANANGNTLADVLKVGVIKGGATTTDDRAALIDEVKEWTALASFTEAGNLVNKNDKDVYTVVIYWEPSENDNDYNMNNGKGEPLTIDIGVTLFATQYSAESDSFNEKYDEYAGLPWDGETVTENLTADENGVYHITSAADLVAMMNDSKYPNCNKYQNVVLECDINLGGKKVSGFGDDSGFFDGIFDGQGYTISNFTIDASDRTYYAGLFNQVSQYSGENTVIKNLTVSNATVIGSGQVGIIAGGMNGNTVVDNCKVINCTAIGVKKVGAVVGYTAGGTVTNNYAENCNVYYSEKEGAEILGYENTGSTVNNNTFKNVAVAKSVTVSNAEQFAAAVTSSDKTIVVTLANDIDVPITSLGQQTGGSGEYKIGGENTETIEINLNAHKLTLTTGYMTAIGAKNADATITIKNGSMNGTGNSKTTWDINDLIFANCNYVFENVTFDKEVALTNTGKTAVMKNVTINGTGDYYALWISARGQNVNIDGLTINSVGRGIKIDEQYVGAPAKVALNVSNATFNTKNKAAIVVKSVKGADIALNNVDISNTIDTAHAVWVDEDSDAYVNLVTVTGGKVISEANVVASDDDLTTAIAKGKTELYLVGEGNFRMPSNSTSATVKIIGNGTTVIDMTWGAYWENATLTFENVVFKTTFGKANGNGSDYAALYSKNVTYNNCKFNGGMLVGRDGATFNTCTFNIDSDYLRTYGNDVTFEKCVFNTVGKAILIYSDGGNEVSQVSVKNCEFNASVGAKAGAIANQNCAAIEIHNYGNGVNLVTEGNTYDSNFSGEWRIKTYETGKTQVFVNGTEYTTIAIDGKTMTIDGNKNVTVNE